jgi:hypothetical protein
MRRSTLRAVIIVGVLVAVSLVAHAFGRHKDMRQRIGQHVNQALDAVKATPAQRNSVQAAVQEVIRTAEDAFGGSGMPDLDQIIDQFSRPRLDGRAIEAIKGRRDARHKKLADALTQAFYDVHDALTAQQRQQLVDYARGRAEGRHMKRFKQTLMEGFINAQVEDVLEQLGANEAERKVVHDARDEVLAAIQKAHATKQASIEELANLFRGDTVDKTGVERFRTDKEAQLKAVQDAVEHAITQIHAGLTPEHRQKLVELVRARRDRAKNAKEHPTQDTF